MYIINDVQADVHSFEEFGIQILNTLEMTEKLRSWEGWEKLSKETTLLLFPGNGATDVRKVLSVEFLSQWHCTTIAATRFWWPGNGDPVAVVESPWSFDLVTRDVVIIDDVISSGATMRKVRERWMPFFPCANWHAVAWIVQNSAMLRGFSSHYGSVEVRPNSKKIPINSLSTLLHNTEIAKSYARRNFCDPQSFLKILDELRG